MTPSFSELAARYARAAEVLKQLVGQALLAAGDEARDALHGASPVGTGRTGGHLANSFFSRQIDPMVVIVGTSQPLKLHWVTQGTIDVEPILPVVKKALWWPEADHPVAWVHGQRADDFVTPIQDEAQAMLDRQVPQLLSYLDALFVGL
jgi:hypothetical protein